MALIKMDLDLEKRWGKLNWSRLGEKISVKNLPT